jgi:syntaxin 18
LTDRQRDQIDAETKQLLRDLNARIRMLADAELVRQNTEETIRKKKYAKLGLGSLGKWAAGGIGQSKTLEEQLDEAKANAISMHRENVLWYLRQKLQECGSFQASMMEKRILREIEKNKSTLAKSRMESASKFAFDTPVSPQAHAATTKAHLEAQELYPEEELTAEQIQVFEKENQDMLKHYESTLDQVK